MTVPDRPALRYVITLFANVSRALLSFLSGLVVARTLGVRDFGDLAFLLGSFAAVSQLLDMGSSSAFYTFLSRRRRRRGFFLWYGLWMMLQFAAPAMVVVIGSSWVTDTVWQGHSRSVILLAWMSSFLSGQAWTATGQLGESVRRTRLVQAGSVAQATIHLASVSLLAYKGWLTLDVMLWVIAIEYAMVIAVVAPRLVAANLEVEGVSETPAAALFREFADYARPLVVYAWVAFVYMFADRWLLQQFGGSVQQGFFGIGQQFATVSLIAVTSSLRVFWKEITSAHERRDQARIRSLYERVTETLFIVAAWSSCLLLPYTSEILGWTVGAEYSGASLTLALMFLYPIHQSLGQVQGTFFFASGQTRTYSTLGLLWMALSLPATFFLLAPPSFVMPGLGLGSVGLALKLVVIQMLAINVQAFVIARRYRWPFRGGEQFLLLALLLTAAFGSKAAVSRFVTSLGLLAAAVNPVTMILGCTLYAILSALALRRFAPSIRDALSQAAQMVLPTDPRSVPATAGAGQLS